MKVVKDCVEGVFWLFIFLSPFITGGLISLFLIVDGYQIAALLVLLLSIVGGILLAEWIRRHHGCAKFVGHLFHHK